MLTGTMYDYRFEEEKAVAIGKCIRCDCNILDGYDYYDFDGNLVCDDCMISYCYEHYRKERGE